MAFGKRKHSRQFILPKLQITSMMDMFTIILIFLLFSFSTKPQTFTLDKDVKLPESTAKTDYNENIKLVLSQTCLRLEGDVVATLENGKVTGLDPDKPKESSLYKKLKAYREEAEALESIAKRKENILFLCDKHHSFKTINNIVKTAAMAGYPNFEFAVLKK